MRLFAFAVLAGLGGLGYVTFKPPACGGEGAVACPSPELANGIGTVLPRGQTCRSAGYLCAGRAQFQIRRWSLERGWLRVRVPPPPVDDKAERVRLQDAAIAGIREWEGHPFRFEIDRGRLPRRPWDIEFYWVPRVTFGNPGGGGGHAGVAYWRWSEQGGEPNYDVNNISTVLYDVDDRGNQILASSGLVAQVSAHEMGHALGLPHSDRESDVLYPYVTPNGRVSSRDLQTVDALYRLPNGARMAR